jgi:hypothetical protein
MPKRILPSIGILVALAVLSFSILQLFPNKAACIASGRTVDPTERHCEGPNGYVQLREHVLFHAREPVLFVLFVGAAVYFVRYRRRKAQSSAPPLPPTVS